METIKRIIMWIINLFRKLFGKKKKKVHNVTNNSTVKNNKNKVTNAHSSTALPSYMMISDQDKLVLINGIQNIKKRLNDNCSKKREIAKIVALLSNIGINTNDIEEYLNKQDFDKLNNKKLDILLNECDLKVKEDVYRIIGQYQDNSRVVKENIDSLTEIANYIKNCDISLTTKNVIKSELLDLSFDKENKENETALLDKDIFNKIKNWDKNIINEVKLEYQKVNYVTISTIMIDQVMDKYQKIVDDYQHHRFNKSYYEKELGKIKEQIDFLKKIKNSNAVYQEIEQLRKELYTKSKDKYDILYNNEIFMNINNKCDELLNKVNQKVIDIKKEENKKVIEEKDKDKQKDEYLKKILWRFQDLNLSRELILLHKEKESEILDSSDISMYLNGVYQEFLDGVNDNFNYQRNKTKTELAKLYNDLNNILSYKKKEKLLSIDHINFKMEDLVNAVMIKKIEVEQEINDLKKVSNSGLIDEKIDDIKEKFIGFDHEKTLKKTN